MLPIRLCNLFSLQWQHVQLIGETLEACSRAVPHLLVKIVNGKMSSLYNVAVPESPTNGRAKIGSSIVQRGYFYAFSNFFMKTILCPFSLRSPHFPRALH
jgi:hypothetical protein